MSRILALRERAGKNKKKIILPEGNDIRVLKAAQFIADEEIADIYILGNQDEISGLAGGNKVSLKKINLLDPACHNKRDQLIALYHEKRKHKGVTLEEAGRIVMGEPVYYAALLTDIGVMDGFVAGASHTTSSVIKAALHCLRLDKNIGTVSSSFIIEFPDARFGEEGLFAYGDCGVIPYPSAKQLAGITITTSELFNKLFNAEPRTAMLSYSTKGSAKGSSIDTILEALAIVRDKRPDLNVDGEMQLDAAIVPEVARKKCPKSKVAGRANVFIFPNLDAGNISYKLSQRLAKARAVGPIIQGLTRPCCDLSRGCGWEDIVDAVSITAIRAQEPLEC